MSARKNAWNPDIITRQRKVVPRATFDANLRDVAGVLYRFYGGKPTSGELDEVIHPESVLNLGEER